MICWQERGIHRTHHTTSWKRSPPELPSCRRRSGASTGLSWSRDGGRTCKEKRMSVRSASTEQEFYKQIVFGDREWDHWRPFEHSLMDTRGGPSSILQWSLQKQGGAPNATSIHLSHWSPFEHSLMDTSGGPLSILWWTPQREGEAQSTQRDVLTCWFCRS